MVGAHELPNASTSTVFGAGPAGAGSSADRLTLTAVAYVWPGPGCAGIERGGGDRGVVVRVGRIENAIDLAVSTLPAASVER